jgi:hypothetical protein
MPSFTFPSPRIPQTEGGSEVVELPLLMLREQALALENVAYQRGLTLAQMMRSVIREVIAQQPTGTPLV